MKSVMLGSFHALLLAMSNLLQTISELQAAFAALVEEEGKRKLAASSKSRDHAKEHAGPVLSLFKHRKSKPMFLCQLFPFLLRIQVPLTCITRKHPHMILLPRITDSVRMVHARHSQRPSTDYKLPWIRSNSNTLRSFNRFPPIVTLKGPA